MSVRASTGRVSAVALNRRSLDFAPTGADWQVSAVPPAHSVVIPGIPEGSGTRTLLVANPGTNRAQVSVSVLGAAGGFAPAGAEMLNRVMPRDARVEQQVLERLPEEYRPLFVKCLRLIVERPAAAPEPHRASHSE